MSAMTALLNTKAARTGAAHAKGKILMELFRYNDTPVRTILKDDEPWFVASDLAKILGYRDSERMTRRLDDDEKSVELLETATGVHTPKKGMYSHKRNHLVINESGLYNAILRSNVYNAKHFRKWVTNEVLPTLRKTGTYTTTPTMVGVVVYVPVLRRVGRTSLVTHLRKCLALYTLDRRIAL